MKSVLTVLIVLLTAASPAFAHHEAIFGPQSSAVLSPTTFFSAQLFDKEDGHDQDKHRETTTVYSFGFKPIDKQPLSFAVVVPITFASGIQGVGGEPAHHGFEDALLTARYRVDAGSFASSIGFDEGYVMGVGGVELPTGTLDHPFGKSAYGQIAAGLLSLEKRPIAVLGYVYYHHRGEYSGLRESGNVFMGGGVAYTPIDSATKLFSVQLGVSNEHTFAEQLNGVPLVDTGGRGVFLHPAVVFQFTSSVQFFSLISLPVTQQWNSTSDEQRFRVGAGVIWILRHS